jgi:hypothetical protein
MIARVLPTALGLALVAAFLPGGPALAGDVAVVPPTPAVIPANDDERRKTLEALAAAAAEKDATKRDEATAAALATMLERRDAAFVPEIKKALGSTDQDVLAAAIQAAASHEMRDEEKRVRKILRSKPRDKKGVVPGKIAAACIDYLGRLSIAGEEATVLEEHLTPLIGDERRMKQSWGKDFVRACILYLGRMKYRPATPFLVAEVLKEPFPADPNDPKNPPAAYWEARHKIWIDAEGWARWALKEITGQEFRSVREWEAWVRQNKKTFDE